MAKQNPSVRKRSEAGVIAMGAVGGLILLADISVVGFFALVQTGLISLQ